MSYAPLAQVSDAAQYGNKAVRLGAALRAGLPVPDGFAVSVDLLQRLAEQPADAAGSLHGLLHLGGGAVAVRSSAQAEDSGHASFAGLYRTELNVTTEYGLHTALQAIWRSGQSESAVQYMKRMRLAGTIRMAAIVQRMVDAEIAGVLFTRDPMSGKETCLIEAAWGLGEVVVNGRVTPDSFRLDPQGRIMECHPGIKDVQLRLGADSGLQELSVADSLISKPCLEDRELRELSALAQRCMQIFGPGLDLEWAYAQGKLYLLQCRPITR